MSRALPIPRTSLAPPTPVAVTAGGVARTVVAACAAVAVGVAIGLVLTAAAIRADAIGTVRAGPWRLFTDVGSPAANPYQRARMARTAEIPLASAQGLTIVARRDGSGERLDGRCSYRLSGPMPAATFWSLEAASTTGVPFRNPAGREVFTSADVLRDVSGRITVLLAPTVEAGNWLPLPGAGHFALTLRLYDTGLTGPGSPGIAAAALPQITRIGCGP